MIEFKNITRVYHNGKIEVEALRNVSCRIESGEFVAIMGPSGSGKSTLLHILGFLDRPTTGKYLISGKDITTLTDDDLARLRNRFVGFVFQQFHLLRRMNALKNVGLPLVYKGEKNIDEKALAKLQAVDLVDRKDHNPNELSGGQQQRVAIARALVNEPMIIFADEPTGNLDSQSEIEIMKILKELNDQGHTIIMVTHEKEIADFAQRVIKMRDGKIISDTKNGAKKQGPRTDYNISELIKEEQDSTLAKLFRYFSQAVSAILANKARAFLSVLGVLIGIAAVIAMMALSEGARITIEERLKTLGSNLLMIRGGSAKVRGVQSGAGAVTRFTFSDIAAIKDLKPMVSKVSPSVAGAVQVVYQNNNWSTRAEGVGIDYGEMRATIPDNGRWFLDEEINARKRVTIIGKTVAEKLFDELNPIGKSIKVNRIQFRIIGVAPTKGAGGFRDMDDTIYIPVTTAMYRVFGKDYIERIYVEIAESEMIPEAEEKIAEYITKRHRLYSEEDSFHIRNMSEIQEMLSTTTKTMGILLGCIAAISLIVGGIGIMNIMLVSVTERTREIGLRKAVGARAEDIMAQFLIESVVLTFSGGLMGIILGSSIAMLLSIITGWSTYVSVFSIMLSSTFSILVGLCFGLWPAYKAAQLDPIEALRYE